MEKELPLNVSRMNIYVNNVLSIYLILEKLEQQIIKRFEKGKEVSLEHLTKCSTMYTLARLAAKAVYDYDNDVCTIQEKRDFRALLAQNIIADCKSVANM